jgi:hypothetical protein
MCQYSSKEILVISEISFFGNLATAVLVAFQNMFGQYLLNSWVIAQWPYPWLRHWSVVSKHVVFCEYFEGEGMLFDSLVHLHNDIWIGKDFFQ